MTSDALRMEPPWNHGRQRRACGDQHTPGYESYLRLGVVHLGRQAQVHAPQV